MQLVNEFVVPRGVDETWAVLTDVERIAPAMPGAELTEITPDGQYHGTVKIKVGPVTAKYGGVASFKELDQVNHHMVLDATGKESSGRGRASALITADLAPEGTDTRVTVTTDLTISGPLAQFGRGAIAEVSSRLLKQFVEQLKETVLADGNAAAAAAPAASNGAAPGSAAPDSASAPATGASTATAAPATSEAATSAAGASAPAASGSAASATSGSATAAPAGSASATSAPTSPAAMSPAPTSAAPTSAGATSGEAASAPATSTPVTAAATGPSSASVTGLSSHSVQSGAPSRW